MDLLNDLLGGDKRGQYDDFVRRYDEGSPWDDIGDEEAQERYQEVAPRLDREQYQECAEEAFQQLTPEQRAEFGRWLESRSREQGMEPDAHDYADSHELASMTSRVQQEQPGILEQIFGGGSDRPNGGGSGGGLLSSPIAKAALAGIATMALKRFMGGH